jgi:hypothetical protein
LLEFPAGVVACSGTVRGVTSRDITLEDGETAFGVRSLFFALWVVIVAVQERA